MAEAEADALVVRAERWLDEQAPRNRRADEMIDEYTSSIAARAGLPLGVLRQIEIEAYARGFSHELAMRRLLEKLAE
jgi:hypothetical protein